MKYLKRFMLASFAAFVVLASYTLALKLPSELSSEVLLATAIGASTLCVISGLISAALVRKNSVAMVMVSQILSIALIGVVWNL